MRISIKLEFTFTYASKHVHMESTVRQYTQIYFTIGLICAAIGPAYVVNFYINKAHGCNCSSPANVTITCPSFYTCNVQTVRYVNVPVYSSNETIRHCLICSKSEFSMYRNSTIKQLYYHKSNVTKLCSKKRYQQTTSLADNVGVICACIFSVLSLFVTVPICTQLYLIRQRAIVYSTEQ